MNQFMAALAGQGALGSLLVRLMFAEIVIVAGYRKFFIAGLGAVGGNFEKYGIPLPQVAAPFIAALELVGGILLALGLGTRYLGVLFACEFVVATWVKWVPLNEGYQGSRLDTMLVVAALLFATQGAGKYSLDAKRGWG